MADSMAEGHLDSLSLVGFRCGDILKCSLRIEEASHRYSVSE
jgi:hypothetical protein